MLINMKFRYGKYVLLTGGSSGIGLATADLFATNGYVVYAGSRDPSLDVRPFPGGGEVRPFKIDVRDEASVKEAVGAILSEADIGIVVHCAGMGIACPAEDFPADAVDRQIDTNFLGVLRVNSQVLPHLRERGNGLCVTTGSVAGMFPVPFQSHYCSSKAALDLYSAALRMELRDFAVRASLLMPGDTSTGFTSARTYVIDDSSVYYETCLKAVKKMEKDEVEGKQPITAARAIFKLCNAKNPPARRIVGFDYKALAFLSRLLPYWLVEYILRKMYLT
ncbi:MAG: SDR family NAD(P)-dependent oxidoreductase [Oscillospiraceae bacterium]|nr:SDR family NAD(P)-dependent oxidoreductase [Oscillospiraceae bacterium]